MTTDDYVRMVSFDLRDLPWRIRRDLVSELEFHLDELPPGTDLIARLGKPHEYAAELRAAAGLEPRRGLVAFVRARRPRNVTIIIVALTAIGLAIGSVVWIDRYQPLAFANSTLLPENAKADPASDNESAVFRKGKPFRYGITVHNTGRFAVRVVGGPDTSYLPVTARLWMSGADTSGGTAGPFKPFRPFTMQPGETRVLFLQGVYACHTGESAGAGVVLGTFPVRFSFLWRTATASIPPGSQLTILFRKGHSCPSRGVPPPTP